MSTTIKRYLFCGGAFRFDRRRADCQEMIPKDYRSIILKDPVRLFADFNAGNTMLSPEVAYVGPYFFTTDKLSGEQIILKEKEMIERCTDAIFLFNEASCPGSVTELMQATMLGKNLHLFYVQKGDDDEIESALHTPCWYPILFSKLTNEHTHLYRCHDYDEAVEKIVNLVNSSLNL
ncbi:MAG: hypothetical protein J6P73_00710 [Bacteroidales bacterium]|nr:hypothetical protein [Bacteroidales bacterium]